MKKIIKLLTASVLALGLAACGENSSQGQDCPKCPECPTCPQGQSYSAVSSVSISAPSADLEQVGSTFKKVTVSATLSANADPATKVEWYVDGAKSAQTGLGFEFQPVAAGEYKIQAKVGSVASNEITVKVSGQTGDVIVSEIKLVDSDTLEVYGTAGAVIAVNGHTIAESSYYDLVNNKYVVDLKEAVAQKENVTVSLTKDGKSASLSYLNDTRALSATVTGAGLVGLDGSYTIVKPFVGSANEDTPISYTIAAVTTDMATSPNTSSIYSYKSTVPEGATWVNDDRDSAHVTITEAGAIRETSGALVTSHTYSVTKNTTAGTYTHTITIDDKSYSVVVNVVEPTETLAIANVKQNGVALVANADGSYTIKKPFATEETNNSIIFSFQANATNYAYDAEKDPTYYEISLFGPGEYGESYVLEDGIEEVRPGGEEDIETQAVEANKLIMNKLYEGDFAHEVSLDDPTLGVQDLAAKVDDTAYTFSLAQKISKSTVAGDYTFTLKVGNQTKEVVLHVVEPTAALKLTVEDAAAEGTDLTRILEVSKNATGDYYQVERPIYDDVEFAIPFEFTVENYQSALAKLADLDNDDAIKDAAENPTLLKKDALTTFKGSELDFEEATANVTAKAVSFGGGVAEDTKQRVWDSYSFSTTAPDANTNISVAGKAAIVLAEDVNTVSVYDGEFIVNNLKNLGVYTYTITIGDFTKTLTFEVIEPKAEIFVSAKEIDDEYTNTASTISVNDITVAASTDGIFYVDEDALELGDHIIGHVYATDFASGTYPYSVKKTYPTITTKDVVSVGSVKLTNVDDTQLSTYEDFGETTGNALAWENAWSINDTYVGPGTYTYEFKVGNISKTIVLKVGDYAEKLKVNEVKIDNVTLPKFGATYGYYLYELTGVAEPVVTAKIQPANFVAGTALFNGVPNNTELLTATPITLNADGTYTVTLESATLAAATENKSETFTVTLGKYTFDTTTGLANGFEQAATVTFTVNGVKLTSGKVA